MLPEIKLCVHNIKMPIYRKIANTHHKLIKVEWEEEASEAVVDTIRLHAFDDGAPAPAVEKRRSRGRHESTNQKYPVIMNEWTRNQQLCVDKLKHKSINSCYSPLFDLTNRHFGIKARNEFTVRAVCCIAIHTSSLLGYLIISSWLDACCVLAANRSWQSVSVR